MDDAQRYQWLKENAEICFNKQQKIGNFWTKHPTPIELDAAIDAAISQMKATEAYRNGQNS